jgi:hypothetical protein
VPFAIRSFLALLLAGSLGVGLPAGAATAGAQDAVRIASVHTSGTAAAHTMMERRGPKHHRASGLWQGRRITYYQTLPAKWRWSVLRAVAQWNRVGGGITFVPTTKRSKAQLSIGYGKIGRSAGQASVGRVRHAWVRLSSSYATKDALDAHNRVEVMAVLTHELGHVLGFEHTRTRCSLMSPVMDIEGCGDVSADRPGYYKCRTVDAALAARFVRLYGGHVRRASATWCLLDPLPSVLPGIAFDDSAGGDVTVRWSPPSFAPAGSRVRIQHWSASSCTSPPAFSGLDYADARARTWQNDDPGSGDNCYRVELVNRYGAGRSSAGASFARTPARDETNLAPAENGQPQG